MSYSLKNPSLSGNVFDSSQRAEAGGEDPGGKGKGAARVSPGVASDGPGNRIVLNPDEEKYRSIFENAVMGIFQTTADGRYLAANRALAKIYGYESVEELRNSVTDISRQLYVDPNRRAEFVRQIGATGHVEQFESQIYLKNGSVRWICENARGAGCGGEFSVLRGDDRGHHAAEIC